jgi:hypothetical protein
MRMDNRLSMESPRLCLHPRGPNPKESTEVRSLGRIRVRGATAQVRSSRTVPINIRGIRDAGSNELRQTRSINCEI